MFFLPPRNKSEAAVVVSPYENLEPRKFWRNGVAEQHPLTVTDLYRKKFAIAADDRIATAGSCFAQHIANYLRANGFSILDKEPPPPNLDDATQKSFGFTLYSARYGNIYTVRQLLQLAEDSFSGTIDPDDFWTKEDRVYDAIRPNIEPRGFESLEEAVANRKFHLGKVREMLSEMNVLIFTLGLTEAWVSRKTGRVYPTAPGTIAGEYDPALHEFRNFTAAEIREDFEKFLTLLKQHNPDVRIILTVSPVPLTATASDRHVLLATMYSKSVLRAVAGELADTHANIDYFPSYEIIASPWSKGFFYESNMRSVNLGGVAAVMRVFFDQHGKATAARPAARHRERVSGDDATRPAARRREKASGDDATREERRARWRERRARRNQSQQGQPDEPSEEDAVCEEVLLEAFAR